MITLCIPYYDAPQMLSEQLMHWRRYPADVLIILVDDASPMYPADEVLHKCKYEDLDATLQVFRIEQNIPWNVAGALNLAFTHAADDWCVSGAIDHILSGERMRALLQKSLHPSKYYRFPRYDVSVEDGYLHYTPRAGCGNLFLLTRELFWRVGGYDEDFAGFYGGVGNAFRRQLNRLAEEVVLEDIRWWHYGALLDGTVTQWDREEYNVHNNPSASKKLKQARIKYNPRNPLRFDWTQTI